MGEVIWLEVLSRGGEVIARHRLTDAEIHIGRGYQNDLILDDPHVAERHLRIFRNPDGTLFAEDLGSINGLQNNIGVRQSKIALDDGQTIQIGHTKLRIRDSRHQVPAERTLPRFLHGWRYVAVLSAILLGFECMLLWLRETTEPSTLYFVMPLVSVALLVAAWSTVWAILSRVFSGQARSAHHLIIALAGLFLIDLYDELVHITAFGVSWDQIVAWEYIGIWCAVGIICFIHLKTISPSHLVLKGSVVAVIIALPIAIQTLNLLLDPTTSSRSMARLLPPDFRVRTPLSPTAFLGEAANLKNKVDQDRKKPPRAIIPGTMFGGDD